MAQEEMCGECGERAATYHEVVRLNGEVHERHLCERCAAQLGLAPKPNASVPELLEQLTGVTAPTMVGPTTPPPKPRPGSVCEGCGLTFAEFKKSGLLGCADCYDAFDRQLGPMIERAHQGGGRHVGKIPKRALEASRSGDAQAMENVLGDARERAARLRLLHEQLEAAVRGEHFERAAQLRDEVRRLAAGDAGAAIDPADPVEPTDTTEQGRPNA
ncbi:MAG: UvrB/UvrC motif-containing protein [Planctomycetota bacterium]